jgi:AcrR family transcriptional regulator
LATRAADTKKRLFDATMELVGERGFADASVDEIVDLAGVAKGTVYYHFSGKNDLMGALIADRLRMMILAFQDAAEAHHGDPRAAIEALVRAELEFLSGQNSFSKLLLTEMWRENRAWRDTLVWMRRDLMNVFRDVITQGVETGEFRGDIEPDFSASALFGMTATVALDWLSFEPDKPLEVVVRQATQMAVRALRQD